MQIMATLVYVACCKYLHCYRQWLFRTGQPPPQSPLRPPHLRPACLSSHLLLLLSISVVFCESLSFHKMIFHVKHRITYLPYSIHLGKRIDVKVHSKVRSTLSEVHKCVSIWYTIPKILISGHKQPSRPSRGSNISVFYKVRRSASPLGGVYKGSKH